ncbi:hypothetical protein ACP3TJ_04315 [Desulforudis sp. 1088]|uniref:hypothetical protein n=1 Tax=unclassified Candidatus Desulforudis TaxID=2635950 RepID=UPI003CE4D31B
MLKDPVHVRTVSRRAAGRRGDHVFRLRGEIGRQFGHRPGDAVQLRRVGIGKEGDTRVDHPLRPNSLKTYVREGILTCR